MTKVLWLINTFIRTTTIDEATFLFHCIKQLHSALFSVGTIRASYKMQVRLCSNLTTEETFANESLLNYGVNAGRFWLISFAWY